MPLDVAPEHDRKFDIRQKRETEIAVFLSDSVVQNFRERLLCDTLS